MLSLLKTFNDARELAVQQHRFAFRQFRPALRLPACLRDHAVKPGQRREGGELRGTVVQAHVRPACRPVMGQVQYVRVGEVFIRHSPSPALCPPIWPFRSMVVPPSIRFIPLSIAFFPNLSCMASVACCSLRSRSSAERSASSARSTAS